MKNLSREFKIGLIILASLVLLVIGLNYLKGINLFQAQRNYFANYERIDGLTGSNPVLLRGHKIGLVKDIQFHPDGSGRIQVEFLINDDNVNIPSDTRAVIFTSDFFGSKAINIVPGRNLIMADPGDTLSSDLEEDLTQTIKNEFEPLSAKITELTQGIDVIVTNLKTVFESEETQGLPQVFASLQRTMESLEQTALKVDGAVETNTATINSILVNIDAISGNLKDNNDELSNIISNVETLSDSLAAINVNQTIRKADQAMASLNEVVQKVNNGEGSMGLLLNSDSLHNEVLATNEELQYLINDIYENPWRYLHVSIFGKREKNRFSRKDQDQMRNIADEVYEERK